MEESSALTNTIIQRHRAAIVRSELSRPVKLAIATTILNENTTFFDYGCGHGNDVENIAKNGYVSAGWDPYYFDDRPQIPADIVNIGYVLNVIESPTERAEALQKAWELTKQVLIVAAQVLINDKNKEKIAYGDGIVTNRNTFQKYYEQEELKQYIDQTLGVNSIPVALGVYFVFRDPAQLENFRLSRFRSRARIPRIIRFEDHQELLTPLINFMTERGRLPNKHELESEAEIIKQFRNFRTAYKVILTATDEAEWDALAYRRSLDIQVYLALTHFDQRPKFKELTPTLQQDIKAFFGSYQDACDTADALLLKVGNSEAIARKCQQSRIGKHLPNALYVHISALEALDPLLRVYEGCASRTIGRMDSATLIKFHTDKPQISYLDYPTFDQDAHPALHSSMQIELPDLKVTYRNFAHYKNPAILHRKETFVTPDYPLYEDFAKLTRLEEKLGLLDQKSVIGFRQGWEKVLNEHGVTIREHRIYYRSNSVKS